MKINREMVVRAGLALLEKNGLEQLTLRRLAADLDVQAATIYWHFKSKEELLDEMASAVLAGGAARLVPSRRSTDWRVWASTFGNGLRQTLLAHRDGARMVAGTRLTDTQYLATVERIGTEMLALGFTVRSAAVLFGTIYNFALSFVMEEQAVFPAPGQRSPRYRLEDRDARLDPASFPFLSQTSPVLFDNYDRRFREGLRLILDGARPAAAPKGTRSTAASSGAWQAGKGSDFDGRHPSRSVSISDPSIAPRSQARQHTRLLDRKRD